MAPDLTPEDALALRLVALARAQRLLVLWGPHYASSLLCVMDLVAWVALGRSLDSVEVVGAIATLDDAHTAVAAVDAFHVAYARPPTKRAGGSEEVARRLALASDLAGPRAINRLVTSFASPMLDLAIRQRELDEGHDDGDSISSDDDGYSGKHGSVDLEQSPMIGGHRNGGSLQVMPAPSPIGARRSSSQSSPSGLRIHSNMMPQSQGDDSAGP